MTPLTIFEKVYISRYEFPHVEWALNPSRMWLFAHRRLMPLLPKLDHLAWQVDLMDHRCHSWVIPSIG